MLPLGFSQIVNAQSTQSITNPTSILSIFLSLLLVVGIIFALAYVMRRFNVGVVGNNQMKVVASMVAGTKEKIIVIQVGDEQHLIGVTSHNISHLSKLDKNLDTKPQSGHEAHGELFKDKLIAAMAGKLNPTNKGDKSDE